MLIYCHFSLHYTLVWCVCVGGVLLLTCGVVLQHRVLAERLEPPSNQNILEVCRGGVFTTQNHWGKQSCAALLLGNIHLNTHRHCGGMRKTWLHFVNLCSVCVRRNNDAVSSAKKDAGNSCQMLGKKNATRLKRVWGVHFRVLQNRKNRWHS